MRRGHLFLAVFLILLGGLLLFQILFGMSWRLFGTAFALALVMLGVYLIVRPSLRTARPYAFSGHGEGAQWWFTGGSFQADSPANRYASFFSSCDLNVPADAAPQIEVEAIFSSVHIRLPAGRRVNLIMESAFGSVSPPEGVAPSFGRNSVIFGEGEILNVYARAVFSSVTTSVG